jgi:hypothetical protein
MFPQLYYSGTLLLNLTVEGHYWSSTNTLFWDAFMAVSIADVFWGFVRVTLFRTDVWRKLYFLCSYQQSTYSYREAQPSNVYYPILRVYFLVFCFLPTSRTIFYTKDERWLLRFCTMWHKFEPTFRRNISHPCRRCSSETWDRTRATLYKVPEGRFLRTYARNILQAFLFSITPLWSPPPPRHCHFTRRSKGPQFPLDCGVQEGKVRLDAVENTTILHNGKQNLSVQRLDSTIPPELYWLFNWSYIHSRIYRFISHTYDTYCGNLQAHCHSQLLRN